MNGQLKKKRKCVSARNANPPIGIENTRFIPLTRGKFAIVDEEDFGYLNQYNWCARKGRHTFYAERGTWVNKKVIVISMHRELLGLPWGDPREGDHKNRNGIDNRKENLRIATTYLNAWNRRTRSDNHSGHRGVSWHKQRKQWQVRISCYGIRKYCGIYHDLATAAKVYDIESMRLWGENAILNFPEKRSEYEQSI